jgi:hypothetical protein
MGSSEQDMESIELSIEQAKTNIGLMESLQRLTANNDFIKIIQSGYFEREPSRLALLKADPSQQNEESQVSIIKQIDSIGMLRQYFITVMQIGRLSHRALSDDEVTKEELLAESA